MKRSGRALRAELFCTKPDLAAAHGGPFEYSRRGIVVTQNRLLTMAQGKRFTRSRQVDMKFSNACAFGLSWCVVPVDLSAFKDIVRTDGDPPSVIRQTLQTSACPYREVRTGAVLRPIRRGPGAGARP